MDSKSQVLAVIAEIVARFNAKDEAAFVEIFTEDADFTNVIGETAHGKTAIEVMHRFPFRQNMRHATLSAENVDVRFLGDDVAVALVKWVSTQNLSLDGTKAPDRKGNMMVVVRRSGAGPFLVVSVLNQDPLGIYGKQVADAGGLPRLS